MKPDIDLDKIKRKETNEIRALKEGDKKKFIDLMMDLILQYEPKLSEWEKNFIEDMTKKCMDDDYNFSSKQIEKIKDIYWKFKEL